MKDNLPRPVENRVQAEWDELLEKAKNRDLILDGLKQCAAKMLADALRRTQTRGEGGACALCCCAPCADHCDASKALAAYESLFRG